MWREPQINDQGTEMLVKSADLIDEDFNKKGVAAGTVVFHDPVKGFEAICATWCNYQDHYHTTEIGGDFFVAEIPS